MFPTNFLKEKCIVCKICFIPCNVHYIRELIAVLVIAFV
jgi:Fe-S-cluster-containing hydrogenase component 2